MADEIKQRLEKDNGKKFKMAPNVFPNLLVIVSCNPVNCAGTLQKHWNNVVCKLVQVNCE